LVAIATIKQSDVPLDNSVNIYLVDTITGSVIYHTYHDHCSGGHNNNIYIVQSENFIVYHYWNIKFHRYEVSVLELFEKQLDWKSTTFSSFDNISPIVLQQSYVFPSGVKAMQVTKTARGISTKAILVALSSDQIMLLSKAFVDPRRPPKNLVTSEDKEEGLIPYDAKLPLLPKHYINYYKQIKNIRGIETAPAYLESTSLVVGYGLDLFFTRVAPSNTFDILNPDFNYFALVVTSVTLLVLTVASSWMSKKKDLQRLWK